MILPAPKHIRLFCLSTILAIFLSGCATLVGTTSIEPYTKKKDRRNALEQLATSYCEQKRGLLSGHPDYIFTTDGCSLLPGDRYLVCCIVHDIAYWCGGDSRDRRQADEQLRTCVNEETAGLGNFMYLGVRLGGIPWLPTPWRWGYGWDNWPSGYEDSGTSPSVIAVFEAIKARELIAGQLREYDNGSAGKKGETR